MPYISIELARKMKISLLFSFILLSLREHCFTLPIVDEKTPLSEKKHDTTHLTESQLQDTEYYRYITQILDELNQDPDLARALLNVTDDKKVVAVIEHLDYVGHNIRKRLDEIKRKEIEYQHELIRQKKLHMLNKEGNEWNPMHHKNSETFEKEDLEGLMKKHHSVMEETEKQRHKEFKEYEMSKEHRRRERMKTMNNEQWEEYTKSYNDKRNQKHEKMHKPGTKAQLEEAWEKDDHLDLDSFDSRTLFNLHDKNGDGYLDLYEAETLFLSEVNKVYNESDPDVDLRERDEELELMSEDFSNSMDTDKDGLVSLDEFMRHRDEPDYATDEEWKPITDEDQFTKEELEEFEKDHYQDEQHDNKQDKENQEQAKKHRENENNDGHVRNEGPLKI